LKNNQWKGALHQSGSIPACTSYECKKDSEVEPWIVPEADDTNWEYNQKWGSLHQSRSVPACNSYECKKDSVVEPWIVPEADENNWEYNQRWGSLAQSQGLPYDPQDENNNGDLYWSSMPELDQKRFKSSSAPLKWAN
jgi:hypothetical protein|tara:strand:+ start:708 stop:1121 length:414 start_codon:yes stop_codon:yes gene_type:complete